MLVNPPQPRRTSVLALPAVTAKSGEPLDDLAGYRILYGRSSSDLDHSVLVTAPATTSYQFFSLSSGVRYFAVVAVNSNGLEGLPTTLATKSI